MLFWTLSAEEGCCLDFNRRAAEGTQHEAPRAPLEQHCITDLIWELFSPGMT